MRGVITRREVLTPALTIVWLFGPRAYFWCLRGVQREAEHVPQDAVERVAVVAADEQGPGRAG